MSSTFTGFSEEDLERIKSGGTGAHDVQQNFTKFKKIDKIGVKPKRFTTQFKLPALQKQVSEDAIDNIDFAKCKLSLKSASSPSPLENVNDDLVDGLDDEISYDTNSDNSINTENNEEIANDSGNNDIGQDLRKNSLDVTPDIVRGVDNYTEDELAAHRVKLEELQLRQKLMEEQNKKRKEMLAKALADRTKQTEEEVLRLEKIKKELQVLDSQFSQDVAVLRKKIDQACFNYAEAEKHYLRVEKEFLQAKINLQKEKEKKELLTEHLCALITHNETRKAQKLETLMLELASDKKTELNNVKSDVNDVKTETNVRTPESQDHSATDDDNPIIIDGVDQRSGKMVEFKVQD